MANTIINPTIFSQDVQLFLRSSLVAEAVCRSQFRGDLYPGKTINYPYASTVRVQNYAYSTDMTIDPTTFTSDSYSIDQVKGATFNFDRFQNMVSTSMDWMGQLADEMGYELSNNIDQYALQTGINGALNTVAGGTLSASNMFEALTSSRATLGNARAGAGTYYAIIDFNRAATLANVDKANGFNLADAALRNGYVGDTAAGFKVFVSNNLPYAVSLTMATQPTAGDTITIKGVTWTFVAAGTAAAAGEVALGADVAATKVILVNAINGTGTPGAATYIDFDADTRRTLMNSQLTAATFSGDVSAITGYGILNPAETFTSANNFFGTSTFSMLLGVMGSIDLTVQAEPEILETQEPKNASKNVLGFTQYGAGVFYRDKAKLLKLTANA